MDAKFIRAVSDIEQGSEVIIGSVPRHRGRMFAAYMENGFTRDEAFTLIVEELWTSAEAGGDDDES